jgi:small-conductance mechanosensitive channel
MNMFDQLKALADRHGVHLSLDVLLGTVLILVFDFVIITYLDRLLQRPSTKGKLPNYFSYETIISIMRLVSIVMWIGVAILILNFWGITVTGLWTAMVSMAAVVGVVFLAVWTMVSNISTSVFLTIWRLFHMGADVGVLPENVRGAHYRSQCDV